jgi:hypothetical protein
MRAGAVAAMKEIRMRERGLEKRDTVMPLLDHDKLTYLVAKERELLM